MSALVDDIRSALRAAADPSLAPGQQAYMKSAMPFLGVRVPEVRRLTRRVVRDLGVRDAGQLTAAATALWDEASLVPLFEHMARTGAWWDHVDELAHRVSELHDADPDVTAELVRGW